MTKPSHASETGQYLMGKRLTWRLRMGPHLWVMAISLFLLHGHVFSERRFDLRE